MTERTDCNVSILFADVSGSTTLYEKLGDARALAAVSGVVELLSKCVAAHGGRVVKTIGDEVMAALSTAEAALEAASDMQNRVSALAPIQGVRLAIRVGFHYGPAIAEGGDYFGDAVNTAARLAGLARAGQIITTSASVAALPELLRGSTRELDALPVKGKEAPVRIAEVIWDEGDDLTMLADRAVATTSGSLALEHAGGRIVMGSFKDGKRDGFVRNYYDSGQIFSEEHYKEGQLDGEAKRYYMDGTVQYISTFKNGQKTSMKAYNKKGQLTYDKKFPYIE